jgi:hemolysin activation/secretion protein
VWHRAQCLLAFASTSLAAGPGAPVLNPGRQLLEQIQGTNASSPPRRLAPKAVNQSGVVNPNEKKFFIRKIEILGVTKLSEEQLHAIVARYENRPLGGSDINVLMETVTRAYVTRGYITSRVYLPEQNIKGGILKLQVLEGRLDSFSTSTVAKSELFTAFPTQPGMIVRLPDLEQGYGPA